MRIKAIGLSWFRGAAEAISIEPDGKSIAIYGANGSGKSSFVDAIEYVLNDGRIGHLAHEYSGKNLKNALPNTHRPEGSRTQLSIKLCDGSESTTVIQGDGACNRIGSVPPWDYRRSVLRQGEVVEFIQDTKGGKYSALLPLFGLQPLEVAAENLRQLAKNVESLSQVEQLRTTLTQAKQKRKASFQNETDSQIRHRIEVLHTKYCPDKTATTDGPAGCKEVSDAINARIGQLTADQTLHLILSSLGQIEIKNYIDDVRIAGQKLAAEVDPFVTQKLAVLQPAEALLMKLPSDGDINCPACGQPIPHSLFRHHVNSELERLREIRETFNSRTAAMVSLCENVRSLKSGLNRAELKSWKTDPPNEVLAPCLSFISNLNADVLRSACDESDLKSIEAMVLPLVKAAAIASRESPADVKELLADKATIEAAKSAIQMTQQSDQIARAEALIFLLKAVEQATRDGIRTRSNMVIGQISDDIKKMWKILHPGESIEDVRLYLPQDSDKAIDIGLKFHGKSLESPRLTLSEGYRNSLGLCIFLAMAKREAVHDSPVILDDVVVSLDRNHRGMIVQLLREEFDGRQILILTHDRDWFSELRQHLDQASWSFRTLLPYESPLRGIRWSTNNSTFDDARAQIKDRPDAASNDARKIMDIELSIISERLYLLLPYLRFDKNDRRTAHEFLERIIALARKCFQLKDGANFQIHERAIEYLSQADELLISWANRASHSFDSAPAEASKLIDVCERALASFKCPNCKKSVWFTDASGPEYVQCQCGSLRWRYGKT